MFDLIDRWLDKITMYKLVMYYLIMLIVIAVVLSQLKVLHFNPVVVAASALYITVICWLSNQIFAYFFEVPANVESTYITALILSLIITPISSFQNALFLTAAGGLAIASKYILAIKKKHIFNPAAVAVALTAFGPRQSASWWIGTMAMLPYVVIGGLLVVRKIQRGKMVISFFVAVLAATIIVNLITHASVSQNLHKTILQSSLFFLAFVMLTEPLTSPPTETTQLWYAAIVGVLFPPQVHIGGLYATPELALLVGNSYAYLVSPKLKLMPKLKQKVAIGPNVTDFVFALDRPINFKPGQYMEWTLKHDNVDGRGNRRYFTLASSPTEDNLRLGVKFYPNGSSYKKAMRTMDNKTPIVAAQLSGDFVLPKDPKQKLAFIAGGIGVTPFRSMIQYLIDKNEPRNLVLLYSESRQDDLAYTDVFQTAQHKFGSEVVYTLTDTNAVPTNWQGQTGPISEAMIKSQIPDYQQRLFYLSGPHTMVVAVRQALHNLGVTGGQVRTDFFPGYT